MSKYILKRLPSKPGTIQWLGVAQCKSCYKQVEAIPMGEGRNTLQEQGWKRKGHRWYCPLHS